MEIVVRQMSGLGNQLFQYAAGLYYATHYKAELTVLIDPAKDPASFGFPRPFQLAAFHIAAPMRKPTPLEQLLSSNDPRIGAAGRTARRLANAQLWLEPNQYRFYPELPYPRLPATVFLRAYCQAAGYAQAVEERLRAELKLREEPNERDAEVLEAAAASRCPVSVHIRRGDYALAEERLVLPLSYYEQACKLMLEEFEGVEFFVFSDDIEFAQKHLPGEGPRRFVSHNNGWSAYQDLRLMAACRHHIIANSSFSWWGSWMNPDPGKVVIAPKYWWNKPESYYPELYPAGWRLVENLIDSANT